MPTLRIVWRASADAKMCQRCRALDGYEWLFIDEELPDMLIHPQYGPVWDPTLDVSRAHGYGQFNCRCTLEWMVDDTDLAEQLELLDLETAGIDSTLEDSVEAVQSFVSLLRSVT